MRRLEAALRLYRELGDPRGIASSLQVLGSVAREQGRYARAVELHAESLAIAEAAEDRWGVASAHGYLAFASWLQRDFGRAAEEASIALAQFRDLGDIEGAAWSLISLGTVARYQGDVERASVLLTESLALSEGIGFREGIAWSVEQLGLLAAVDGDPAAISLLRRSLELHSELRDQWRMSSVLEDLAAIALAQGNAPRAARLLGAAEAIREAIGTVIAPCERLQHNQTTKAVRTALGDDAFDAALRQGQLAPMDELTADLPSAAPPEPPPSAPDQAGPDRTAPDQAPPDQTPPDQEAPDQAASGQAASGQAAPSPARAARPKAAARPRAAQPAAEDRAAEDRASGNRASGNRASGNRASGMLRIRVLGAAVVEVGDTALTAADWSYAKPRELMFLLAASPPMTKDQIAAALWPDLSRQQLGNALHTALRELRRALGDPGWVRYSDGHYRFDRSRPHECDVTAFEDALLAARRARPAEAALPELQRAIAVYGGDFLDGMATGEWALVRRDELRRAFESALLATGRMQAAAGRHQAAAAAFRRAVAHEPLNESAHRELMNCWARLGETARAVRHYEELAGVLREQVGVAPAAETEALYRRLLDGPIGRTVATPRVSPSFGPFPLCWPATLAPTAGSTRQPAPESRMEMPSGVRSDPAARRPPASGGSGTGVTGAQRRGPRSGPRAVRTAGAPGHLAAAADQRRRRGPHALTCFMALRLPLAVRIMTVLRAPGLALVICERHTAGTGPDGEEIKYRGNGCAVVRAQPDGTWRIAADAWHLGAEDLGPEDGHRSSGC